ncbi:MAG: hypothetical protein IPI70_12825 [Nitrospira sp.]|nr:hypothetical protein [Nitrospira sp.]
MAKRVKSSQEPADLLSRHIEEIRETLAAFQPFLSRRKGNASLDGFDEQAEEILSETFGGLGRTGGVSVRQARRGRDPAGGGAGSGNT